MEIYNLYSIKDKFTCFMNPAIGVNDDSAKRDFSFAINNNPGVMNFSPADYDLYRIGEFNKETGVLIQNKIPQFICNGLEVMNEK